MPYLGQSPDMPTQIALPEGKAASVRVSLRGLTDADPHRGTGHLQSTKPPGSNVKNESKLVSRPPAKIPWRNTGFHRFPLNNFKYFLTLFSKFFSPFVHTTCSLSVSPRYLALDETYHPFYVALPSNATLRTQVVRGKLRIVDGILTLCDALFQKTYIRVTR